MTEFESRFLGPIRLNGGVGGGAMESIITFGDRRLLTRLEIDHPGRLTQSLIDDVDVMLSYPHIPDGLARNAMAELMASESSAPARLYAAWRARSGAQDQAASEFLRCLQPVRMVITPDGGRVNRDRVVLEYGLPDSSISGVVTVRLPAGSTGPVVDRAPVGGY